MKLDPPEEHKIWPFFPDSDHYGHINPSISGTISNGSGLTGDFSSRFGRNLAGFDKISPDLRWIWQDLVGSGEISSRFIGFR